MPTARNVRGVDVIAYDKNATRYISVQVKTLSKRTPVPLGTSINAIMGDYWVVINRAVTDPNAFVLLPSEVKDRAHRGEKDGRISFWLQPKDYEIDEFRSAWHRLPDLRQ